MIQVPNSVLVTIGIFIIGIVIALVTYIWKIKAEEEPMEQKKDFLDWRNKHEETHKALSKTIFHNTTCITQLKTDVSSIQSRCTERTNLTNRILECLDSLGGKLDKTNEHLHLARVDIEGLKAGLKSLNVEPYWDGRERRRPKNVS